MKRRSVGVLSAGVVLVATGMGTSTMVYGAKGDQVFDLKLVDIWTDEAARKLVLAASQGRVDEVSTLVKAGVAVDAIGKYDWTPLAWATVVGNTAGMERLLQLGANPNRKVIDSRTGSVSPFVMMIAQRTYPDRLEVLLRHGLNPNSRWGSRGHGYEGDTLLSESVMSKPCVELLVKYKVDINFAHEVGQDTAIDRAAGLGQLPLVEWLLDHGARARLDLLAYTLQHRVYSESSEPQRVRILRRIKELGAPIYASKLSPNTPSELITPGPVPDSIRRPTAEGSK